MKLNIKKQTKKAFTVVELIIVVVVIGILATLSIVAYNGLQQNAKTSSLLSDLDNSSAIMAHDYNANGIYPANPAAADGGRGLPTNSGTTYQYTVNNSASPATFCLTGTNGNMSYYISSTQDTPVKGGCPGDGINGNPPITNLVVNPSVESGTLSPNSSYFSAPASIDTTTAASGTNSVLVTTNSTTNAQGYIWQAPNASPSTAYVCSIYLKGTPGAVVAVAGRAATSASAYIGEGYGAKNITLTTSWQRVSVSFTSPATAGIIYIQYHLTAAASGINIWGDGAMCTQGTALYNYADGDSASWEWTGTTRASASTGPAL